MNGTCTQPSAAYPSTSSSWCSMRELKIGEFVSVVRDGAVATVTMDRGDGRNALSRQLILEMTEAAKQFADDLETQAVILTGNGAFTAGADLKRSEEHTSELQSHVNLVCRLLLEK